MQLKAFDSMINDKCHDYCDYLKKEYSVVSCVLYKRTVMWLVEKIRETVESNICCEDKELPSCTHKASKQKFPKLHSNVLTPDMIPDFFIPPKISIGSEGSFKCLAKQFTPTKLKSSVSENNIQCFANSPCASFRSDSVDKQDDKNYLVKLANRQVIQIESAEDLNGEDMQNTDEDGRESNHQSYPACLPLPQLPTYYEFSTFLESPHTRRRESLFHTDRTYTMTQWRPGLLKSKHMLSISGPSLQANHLHPSDTTYLISNVCKTLARQGPIESDVPSSTESSPFSSPLLPRSLSGSSLFRLFSQENISNYTSRSTLTKSLGRNSSFSTDECSSEDNSPSSSRKPIVRSPTSLACCLIPPPLFSFDLLQCQERLQKEHVVQLHQKGTIRLSAEYESTNGTLRVRIIAAEDLYEKSFEAKSVQCRVVMYLIPGKTQKQQSTIIKNTKTPIFNEDFFFDGVTENDFKTMSLKVKVLNKGSSIKRDALLGTKVLPLTQVLPL
ncbi:C2 calcium-dependent domain-containing protein 4C-like [Latimeria chalumnae]